jgi:hypothetical protein
MASAALQVEGLGDVQAVEVVLLKGRRINKVAKPMGNKQKKKK